MTDDNLWVALTIRTRVATCGEADKPMVWLNDCVDAVAKPSQAQTCLLGAVSYDFLLQCVAKVMTKTRLSNQKANTQVFGSLTHFLYSWTEK